MVVLELVTGGAGFEACLGASAPQRIARATDLALALENLRMVQDRMTNLVASDPTEAAGSASGESILGEALRMGVPVAAVLGQLTGWSDRHPDPVLKLALTKAARPGEDWKSLLTRDPLPEGFYEWLGERFLHRAPSTELQCIADAALSAVYTSSIDPGLLNLFSTGGRQPEAVLSGDPPPPILRSRRRVPVYYLFGRASAGIAEFVPPGTNQSLSQRRLRHASAMLKTLNETATALGLVVVDGYDPSRDWLRAEDLLAVLGGAPTGGVLWCGREPEFSGDDAETYNSLVSEGVVVRDGRSLARLLATLRASGQDIEQERWDEPGIISFSDGKQLITTARLRLSTQATAAIVDDGWLGFLPPLTDDAGRSAFAAFHSVPASPLGLIEGLRRGFAITREFEEQLSKRVNRAIAQHHQEMGAIILHGQSGVGKSIALGRLALAIRENRSAAVLFAYNRLPQATDVADFLAEVDKMGGVTVLIADSTSFYQRYDDLLQAFRSRGHRVVVVGSSYRLDSLPQLARDRFSEAHAELSQSEAEALVQLSQRFGAVDRSRFAKLVTEPHALARFFWELPSSRTRLSEGLGREARTTVAALRARGTSKRRVEAIGGLGLALIRAGYEAPTTPLIPETEGEELGNTSLAERVIDYVMAVSRLYRWVPVNLLLRAVLSEGLAGTSNDIELIRELFEGLDIFRWRFADDQGEELLVGARLQIEAELICNRRLGGSAGEAQRVVELFRSAVRAGAEGNEETKFLVEVAYALGPDGPFGERYRDSYALIARALTELRRRHGVLNARLMLQESTLRRHYVRTHSLDHDEKATLLDEARAAVDEALQAIERSSQRRLYASRRTRDNLWVERAATYGFLATDSAQHGADNREIWSSYKAARDAVRIATGRVDTYFPLDIGLWLPADVLRDARSLGPSEKLELEADIRSTLDEIDPEALDPAQFEMFQRQRFRVGAVLGDAPLAEEAFAALAAAGSAAGYYLRARAFAPKRPETGEVVTPEAQKAARRAVKYLQSVYDKIAADFRCLTLLLWCEWVSTTGRWLFRGQRQPLPFRAEDRLRIRNILLDLLVSAPNEVQARYRYLDAVLNWLTTDEAGARQAFRALAAETEYVERARVVARNTITDENGQPVLFNGIVERQLADRRWSVFVEQMSRRVDFVESERGNANIAVGRTLRGFAISFNYLGPIADLYAGRISRS